MLNQVVFILFFSAYFQATWEFGKNCFGFLFIYLPKSRKGVRNAKIQNTLKYNSSNFTARQKTNLNFTIFYLFLTVQLFSASFLHFAKC